MIRVMIYAILAKGTGIPISLRLATEQTHQKRDVLIEVMV